MSTPSKQKKTTPKPLTVGDLIEKLKTMPLDLPVWVSDGTGYHFYNLDETVTVEKFVGLDDGKIVCDIGVGYCREGE
jgi:hypothetical protein